MDVRCLEIVLGSPVIHDAIRQVDVAIIRLVGHVKKLKGGIDGHLRRLERCVRIGEMIIIRGPCVRLHGDVGVSVDVDLGIEIIRVAVDVPVRRDAPNGSRIFGDDVKDAP